MTNIQSGSLKSGILKSILCLATVPFLTITSAQAQDGFGLQPPHSGITLSEVQLLNQSPAVAQFLKNSGNSLKLKKQESYSGIQTSKFQAYYFGLEVIGSQALVHNAQESTDLLARFDLNLIPQLRSSDAISIARSYLGDRGVQYEPILKVLPNDDGSARLVYWLTLRQKGLSPGADFVVDAQSGELIAEVSHHHEIAPVEVYNAAEGQIVEAGTQEEYDRALPTACQVLEKESGYPIAVTPKNCAHVVKNGKAERRADQAALRAAQNAKAVLNYYQSSHGRNSFDNQGSPAISIVHVGQGFPNAFWNSQDRIMAYGDGDGQNYDDFTKALDVAAHELTHGVVSETANLLYFGESGALNEASADFFGKAVAKDGDWIVGKEIMVSRAGIRNLANPGSMTARYRDDQGKLVAKPYPAHVSQAFKTSKPCGSTNDHCFVHLNSTVFGHALYQLTQSVGPEKAQKMYYLALTQFMTERSDFKAGRQATLRACGQLFDAGTCTLATQAFAKVGL